MIIARTPVPFCVVIFIALSLFWEHALGRAQFHAQQAAVSEREIRDIEAARIEKRQCPWTFESLRLRRKRAYHVEMERRYRVALFRPWTLIGSPPTPSQK